MSEHEGHRKRLRERYLRAGLEGMAEHEVLELILTYAIPRRDVKPIAKELIFRFQSLRGVMQAREEELCTVDGVGESAAALIRLFLPVAQMCARQAMGEKPCMDSARVVKEYCRALIGTEREEKLYLLCLDPRLRLKACVFLAGGTVNGIQISSRQIAEEALRGGATGVILTHNHPSGNPEPSREDIAFTREIKRTLMTLDIHLYDHIIVGEECVSLKERGEI